MPEVAIPALHRNLADRQRRETGTAQVLGHGFQPFVADILGDGPVDLAEICPRRHTDIPVSAATQARSRSGAQQGAIAEPGNAWGLRGLQTEQRTASGAARMSWARRSTECMPQPTLAMDMDMDMDMDMAAKRVSSRLPSKSTRCGDSQPAARSRRQRCQAGCLFQDPAAGYPNHIRLSQVALADAARGSVFRQFHRRWVRPRTTTGTGLPRQRHPAFHGKFRTRQRLALHRAVAIRRGGQGRQPSRQAETDPCGAYRPWRRRRLGSERGSDQHRARRPTGLLGTSATAVRKTPSMRRANRSIVSRAPIWRCTAATPTRWTTRSTTPPA